MPYWPLQNYYDASSLGRYHYFFGCSDDSIRDEDGRLYGDPNVTDYGYNYATELKTPNYPWAYTYRYSFAENFWTEQHNPAYWPDTRYDTNQDGFKDSMLAPNNYIMVDRPTLIPGVDTGSVYGVIEEYPAELSADKHPIVRPSLVGVNGPPYVGQGLFLGTLEPYYRAVNPVYFYPDHGASAPLPRNHWHAGVYSWGADTSGATTKQTLTFKVMYRSMDPDTGTGKPPVWVKLFINNASDAGHAGRDDGRGIDAPNPSDSHYYRSIAMSPMPGQVINATTLARGIIYQVQTNLPTGGHTYFFEAYDGFMYTHFPVRPDGRFIYKIPSPGEEPKGVWYEDPWVPGDVDLANNNDFCPGPYVNSPPQFTDPKVTPTSGTQGTDFEFSVTYRDGDGQRPYRAECIFDTGYQQITLSMKKKNPSKGTQADYLSGVVYVANTASLEGVVVKPGLRRYKFRFIDNWGRVTDPNDLVSGEQVYYPGVDQWIQGPLVIEAPRPELLDGNVSSNDGSATDATTWTYRTTYRHAGNREPSYVKLFIGDRGNGPKQYVLQRATPTDATHMPLHYVPIVSVTGVWDNPNGEGTNYYGVNGSFDSVGGILTLDTELLDPSADVYVTYNSDVIEWDAGHDMSKRDPADTLYTDGAIYEFATRLPGAETGETVRRYVFAFEASDGNYVATYDSTSSPSAYAIVGDVEPFTDWNGNGQYDVGEPFTDLDQDGIHDAGGEQLVMVPVPGSDYTRYEFAHAPLAGPVPVVGRPDLKLVPDPVIYWNGSYLAKNDYSYVVIPPKPDRLTVDVHDGFLADGQPMTTDDVIRIISVKGSTLPTRDIEYFDTTTDPGTYDPVTGIITLSTELPADANAYVEFLQRGDYFLDYYNGMVVFNQPNNPSDLITADYWFSELGPTVGVNTPPTLTDGTVMPRDGGVGTSFTFSVTYWDTDGPRGQAPQYVRVFVDGNRWYNMAYSGGGQANYRGGAVFRYTISDLAPGSHSYHFEASDGAGFAVLDKAGSRNSDEPIASLTDFDGPYVGVPLLTSGEAKPNPPDGTIDSNQSVTYNVVYYNYNNSRPNDGNPVLWIDNTSETAYVSLVGAGITPSSGPVLRDPTQEWQKNALVGKFVQFMDGFAINKVFMIKSNTSDTLEVEDPNNSAGKADLYQAGVRSGNKYRIGGLQMKKLYELQTSVYSPVVVPVTVGDSLKELHVNHLQVTGVIAVYTSNPPIYPATDYFQGGTYDFDTGTIILGKSLPAGTTTAYVWAGVGYYVTIPRLLPGTHTFHFKSTTTVSQGGQTFTQEARFPRLAGAAGELEGPNVVQPPAGNSAPMLTSSETGGVSPAHGKSTDSFTFTVYYSDADDDWPNADKGLPGYIRLKIDLESGEILSYPMLPVSTPANYITPVLHRVIVPTLPGGLHRFHFEASDGYRSVRLASFPVYDLAVRVNNKPELTLDGIDALAPSSGNPGVQFKYQVMYSDADGNPPAFVRVVVDGTTTHEMYAASQMADYVAGVLYEKTLLSGALSVGLHTFQFFAQDRDAADTLFVGETVELPVYSGPNVTTSAPPVLSEGEVIPAKGGEATEFNFRVKYSDPDNDEPWYVKVIIDGTEYEAALAGNPTYKTGALYSCKKQLAPGTNHNFYFKASDWATEVRYPSGVGHIDGPEVSYKPTLALGTVTPAIGIAGTEFTFRVTYRDPDGVEPLAGVGYVRGRVEGLPEPIELSKVGNPPYNYVTGVVYEGKRALQAGSPPLYQHRYYFEASDGYDAVRLDPLSNVVTVYEGTPELKVGTVKPTSGTATTLFVYSVYYFDPNNQAPRSVTVVVDGVRKTMSKVDTSDNNYKDGALYQYSNRLSTAGVHTYYFEAETTAFGTLRFPTTGVLNQPTVTTSTLTIGFDNETPNVGDTITVLVGLSPRLATDISLKIVKPNLSTQSVMLTTNSSGEASTDVVVDVTGTWKVSAYWDATGTPYDSAEATVELTVGGYGQSLDVKANQVQMVCPPVRPPFGSVEEMFGADVAAALRIARWDPLTGQYVVYMQGSPFPDLLGGEGFWIKPQRDLTLAPKGEMIPQDSEFSVAIYAGWNQVGHCFLADIQWKDTQFAYQNRTYAIAEAAAKNLIRDYAWTWDPVAKSYVMVHASKAGAERILKTWRAYWVKALVNGTLVFQPPAGPIPTVSAPSVTSTVSGPVRYTVTFSAVVTGFNSSADIQINSTGTASVGLVTISGSGAGPYTVTLANMTGDGTVGITVKAGAATDAGGNTNQASSSSQTVIVENLMPPGPPGAKAAVAGVTAVEDIADYPPPVSYP